MSEETTNAGRIAAQDYKTDPVNTESPTSSHHSFERGVRAEVLISQKDLEANFVNIPTADQKAALDAANAPTGLNAVATIDDLAASASPTVAVYTFRTSTGAPASGEITMNNVDPTLATSLNLHNLNRAGINTSNILLTLGLNDVIVVQDIIDGDKAYNFDITGDGVQTGGTGASGYITFPVTFFSQGPTPLADNDIAIAATYIDGANDAHLTVLNNLSDLNNVATALVNLGLSPTDDVAFDELTLTDDLILDQGDRGRIRFIEADGGTNEKEWDILISAGTFKMRTRKDGDLSGAGTFLEVSRAGIVVDVISFPEGLVNIGDNTDATSTTAASLTLDGGLGVKKRSFFGNALTVSAATQAEVAAFRRGDVSENIFISIGKTSNEAQWGVVKSAGAGAFVTGSIQHDSVMKSNVTGARLHFGVLSGTAALVVSATSVQVNGDLTVEGDIKKTAASALNIEHTAAQAIVFKTTSIERMSIDSSGLATMEGGIQLKGDLTKPTGTGAFQIRTIGADALSLFTTNLERVNIAAGGDMTVQKDLHAISNIFNAGIKSGATQGAAGAIANEQWKTSGHATLPDNVLMIGV